MINQLKGWGTLLSNEPDDNFIPLHVLEINQTSPSTPSNVPITSWQVCLPSLRGSPSLQGCQAWTHYQIKCQIECQIDGQILCQDMPDRMSEYARDRCETACQTVWQVRCQVEWQKNVRECQNMRQINCQDRWKIQYLGICRNIPLCTIICHNLYYQFIYIY